MAFPLWWQAIANPLFWVFSRPDQQHTEDKSHTSIWRCSARASMKQQRAAAPATRPRPTRSKTLPSGSFINRIEHDALGQHTASTSVFDWLDLSLSSPLTFANIFRCLIFEAESELEALELESDWDSAEDEDEQVSTLLKSNKHRSTSLHALADSPSPEAEFAALKQFLIQSRAYISTLKTIMLANLPSSSEPLRDRFAKSSSAAPGPPSFGRLFVTLSSMHDMLNSIIDNTSTTLGSAPTTWKDTMSTSFDPLRSATAIFLSKLPEPPSLPLARLRASLAADSEWLANTLASLGPYSPSAGRRRFSLFAGSLSSQASDLVGQAGDKVREEGHKLKEAFVEEKERLGQLLGEEAEKFKRALHQGANRLLSYDDLPFLWQNNEYIRSGYRFIPIERKSFLEQREVSNLKPLQAGGNCSCPPFSYITRHSTSGHISSARRQYAGSYTRYTRYPRYPSANTP